MTMLPRRAFLAGLAGAAGLAAAGPLRAAAAVPASLAKARVVVVGGGYAGATAARYLRRWSGGTLPVTLVEPEAAFVSCPMSNLVLGGSRTLDEMTRPYDRLAQAHGVTLVRDAATGLDAAGRRLTLASGQVLAYDKLVLAPGVEMMWDALEGSRAAHDAGQVLQAWSAGPETLALARQLKAMREGGTVAIVVPEAPYRCPPGPYERACQLAAWCKAHNPRAKVLVLDANEDITSKGPLFRKAWAERYPGLVEYRPQHKATSVDGATRTVRFEFQDDLRADVLNVLPPMRAGGVAVRAGLATANGRWCEVDFLTFESVAARHVHVLGDAIQTAPLMPKSGHMANAQAKVCAAAIVAELAGWPPDPAPVLSNTCYSFLDASSCAHIASVHAWSAEQKTFLPVPGAGGLSHEANEAEAKHAWGWAHGIWADMLG